MTTTPKVCTFVALALSLGCVVAPAQDSASADAPAAVPLFVTDRHGVPTTDITASGLAVMDNGKSARSVVGLHKAGELPLHLGIIIDKSNSERQTALYRASLLAMFDFVNQTMTGENGRLFVETFDSVAVPPSAWMTARQFSSTKLDLIPSGGSALYDAIDLVVRERLQPEASNPVRRVLIILSDGGDNNSHTKFEQAVASLQRSNTVVFVISTSTEDSPYMKPSKARLKEFATATGGYAFVNLTPKGVADAFSRLRGQLAAMYRVAYVPSDVCTPGELRKIEIKLPNKKLTVHAPNARYCEAQP